MANPGFVANHNHDIDEPQERHAPIEKCFIAEMSSEPAIDDAY